MTNKDYALIAAIIVDLSDIADHERVARTFMNRLGITNPRFDRARFLRACGVDAS